MVNVWLNRDKYLYNNEKAFESAQGEKRHQFISLESAPALQKAKQISFAINYKLLILAPLSLWPQL